MHHLPDRDESELFAGGREVGGRSVTCYGEGGKMEGGSVSL